MELPNSNSSVEIQFRNGFLGLLETLRFSVVLLHNEIGKYNTNANVKPNPNPDGVDENPPQALELMEGKNNFITRIEHLKHNVAYQPEVGLKEMRIMIAEFETLKADIINVLQTKVADQNRTNPQGFFSPSKNVGLADVLKKSIEQINQNWIKINGSTLQIHTASIPEEKKANLLSSSGSNIQANRRV